MEEVVGQAAIQRLEDYRRKARFKQVKFSMVVVAWQGALLLLAMLLLRCPSLATLPGRVLWTPPTSWR